MRSLKHVQAQFRIYAPANHSRSSVSTLYKHYLIRLLSGYRLRSHSDGAFLEMFGLPRPFRSTGFAASPERRETDTKWRGRPCRVVRSNTSSQTVNRGSLPPFPDPVPQLSREYAPLYTSCQFCHPRRRHYPSTTSDQEISCQGKDWLYYLQVSFNRAIVFSPALMTTVGYAAKSVMRRSRTVNDALALAASATDMKFANHRPLSRLQSNPPAVA